MTLGYSPESVVAIRCSQLVLRFYRQGSFFSSRYPSTPASQYHRQNLYSGVNITINNCSNTILLLAVNKQTKTKTYCRSKISVRELDPYYSTEY